MPYGVGSSSVVFAALNEVTITGSNVTVGATAFAFDGPRTIYGLAADQPDADAAHAVVPFAYYVSVDTNAVDQTDGTNWVAQ